MKKVHIIQHNGGRLANQLWNYASIYAYCLEKEYECFNPSFFRYAHLFDNVELSGFGKMYRLFPSRKLFTLKYNIISWLQSKIHNTVFSHDEFILPPSENKNTTQIQQLKKAEQKNNIYFSGWKFRNEDGLKKYHKEIAKLFIPVEKHERAARLVVDTAIESSEFCIGVHIRQGDYKTWEGGKYYVSPENVVRKLQTFLAAENKYTKENTVFVICSDEEVSKDIFGDLNITFGPNTAVGDLYTLSLTDAIIGSHSTYGPWAAYIGGIQFTEFSKI